jgi:hypothetical protein
VKRPDWWRPAHTEAVEFLVVVAVAGALGGVIGAVVDRRHRT